MTHTAPWVDYDGYVQAGGRVLGQLHRHYSSGVWQYALYPPGTPPPPKSRGIYASGAAAMAELVAQWTAAYGDPAAAR